MLVENRKLRRFIDTNVFWLCVSFPFSFQFFTRLAAVFAEAALRGNVITAKHGSRAFEGALISILAEVRQLGVLRFLLAGFR